MNRQENTGHYVYTAIHILYFTFVFFTETKDIRFHNIIYFKDLFLQINNDILYFTKQLIQNFIQNVLFYYKMHVKSDFLL